MAAGMPGRCSSAIFVFLLSVFFPSISVEELRFFQGQVDDLCIVNLRWSHLKVQMIAFSTNSKCISLNVALIGILLFI
jgi:hypothetical protein